MSHITGKKAYQSLAERLNRFPQGAPASKTLYKILEILFTQKEAELVAQLPIKPFTAHKASKIWGLSLLETEITLEKLASKAILLDVEQNGEMVYVLPPPMAGFFEFSLMRTRGDIDQKVLSELFHQYLNVEEDFIKDLFTGTETSIMRTYVQEPVLSNENMVEILDFQRATHVIESSVTMGISMCYCRHKAFHLGENCDAPMDICMSFGTTAESLIRHRYARKVDHSEGIELLHLAYENKLVQCGENSREEVSFICNCCGCCCEALQATKKFGNLHPVAPSSFLPKIEEENCVGCGICVAVCPIDAIKIDIGKDGNKIAIIDEDICLGCGICVRSCLKNAIIMQAREKQVITPVNSMHRIVKMAIEKGMLQELIFDNKALWSHRAMAGILGVILELPPIQRKLASEQIKSNYLEKLMKKVKNP